MSYDSHRATVPVRVGATVLSTENVVHWLIRVQGLKQNSHCVVSAVTACLGLVLDNYV